MSQSESTNKENENHGTETKSHPESTQGKSCSEKPSTPGLPSPNSGQPALSALTPQALGIPPGALANPRTGQVTTSTLNLPSVVSTLPSMTHGLLGSAAGGLNLPTQSGNILLGTSLDGATNNNYIKDGSTVASIHAANLTEGAPVFSHAWNLNHHLNFSAGQSRFSAFTSLRPTGHGAPISTSTQDGASRAQELSAERLTEAKPQSVSDNDKSNKIASASLEIQHSSSKANEQSDISNPSGGSSLVKSSEHLHHSGPGHMSLPSQTNPTGSRTGLEGLPLTRGPVDALGRTGQGLEALGRTGPSFDTLARSAQSLEALTRASGQGLDALSRTTGPTPSIPPTAGGLAVGTPAVSLGLGTPGGSLGIGAPGGALSAAMYHPSMLGGYPELPLPPGLPPLCEYKYVQIKGSTVNHLGGAWCRFSANYFYTWFYREKVKKKKSFLGLN